MRGSGRGRRLNLDFPSSSGPVSSSPPWVEEEGLRVRLDLTSEEWTTDFTSHNRHTNFGEYNSFLRPSNICGQAFFQ